MNKVEQAAEQLAEKKKLFERYYEVTLSLIGETDPDDIEKYITERDSLANKIDKIDSEVALLLAPWGEQVRELLGGRAKMENLPDELVPLHGLCGEIIDIVRSIRLRNTEAVARCQQFMNDADQRIREVSNMPKISKYLTNLAGPREPNNFGSV